MFKADRTEQPDNWQSLGSVLANLGLAGLPLPWPQESATVHALPPRRQPASAPDRQPQAA